MEELLAAQETLRSMDLVCMLTEILYAATLAAILFILYLHTAASGK
jgi:hypothetical protein